MFPIAHSVSRQPREGYTTAGSNGLMQKRSSVYIDRSRCEGQNAKATKKQAHFPIYSLPS